ncbi:MAG: OsmC family protein [Alphaproteobacteria bacterium]
MNDVMTQVKSGQVNGIDIEALKQEIHDVAEDPAKGIVRFAVKSAWQGQTKSRATVDSYHLGGQEIKRHFEIDIDEPAELLGQNTAPNPQEMLMAALNACIMVGYVAGAAMKGIHLDKVEIETSGQLDLRGFLGIDAAVPPGYETIHYTVTMKGNGSEADFREIHEIVMKTSPNYFNISRPIRIDSTLVVEA